MTPFAIRRTVRSATAGGLRLLADTVRPEGETLDVSGSVDAAPSAPSEAGEPPEPETPPAEDAPSVATPAEPMGAAAMSMMGGLSGDMGPALSSRAQEARAQAEADAEVGGETYDQILAALHTVFDPEIPVDIYELGLIYRVDVREDDSVGVQMTLTSPNCPAAQDLPAEVHEKVLSVPGVLRADVDVVFDPPWTPDLMSDAAKLELNMM